MVFIENKLFRNFLKFLMMFIRLFVIILKLSTVTFIVNIKHEKCTTPIKAPFKRFLWFSNVFYYMFPKDVWYLRLDINQLTKTGVRLNIYFTWNNFSLNLFCSASACNAKISLSVYASIKHYLKYFYYWGFRYAYVWKRGSLTTKTFWK